MLNWSLAEVWWQANPDSALYYSEQLYREALSLRDTANMMNGLRSIAISHDYAYRTELAKSYYDSTYALAQQVGDSLQIANYYFNLGTLMISAGDFVAALPFYEKAIALYTILPESEFRLAVTYTNLAYVYRLSRRFQDAVVASKKALALLRHQPNALREADFNADLGDAYTALQEYDSAERYYQRVYNYAIAEQDNFYLCSAANGLGIVAFKRGNYSTAKSYFELARAQNSSDPSLLISIYGYLGAIHSRDGNLEEATTNFNTAKNHIDEKMMGGYTLILYDLLANHYERFGKFDQAYSYLKKYRMLNEQFVSQDVINRTAEWERRYQTQEKEIQIAGLTLERQRLELETQAKVNERNLFILSSLLLSLITLSVGYFYYNRRKASLVLEEKNKLISYALREKELLMREIHHRVKNNLQVITSLLSLQKHFISGHDASTLIQESKNRVHAMSLIHQRLYQETSITEVNMREYVVDLLANLEAGYQMAAASIEVQVHIDDFSLDVDLAIPIGLIINELVTNAYKHAFSYVDNGIISVSFSRHESSYILYVTDNGNGLKSDLNSKQSLGTLLITDLSKKLRASVEIKANPGYAVKLVIPKSANHI